MNEFRQDPILEMRGGYYDLKDPKFIYINKNLTPNIRKEVEAHERFHRSLTTTTVYGQIILTIDYCLSNYKDQLPENDYDELLLARNRMFYNMYYVQEAGALASTYAVLPFIYSPRSLTEINTMQSNFHSRLVQPYDQIAKLYIDFIKMIYQNLNRLSPALISYTNHAITAASCNSIMFKSNYTVDFSSEKLVYLTESFSPDFRFFKILNELVKPKNNQLFFSELKKGLKEIFGIIDIYSPNLYHEIAEKLLQDVDGTEHKMINIIDKCLRACMPSFSIEQENMECEKFALVVSYEFHEFFKQYIPDYKIPTFCIVEKHNEKVKIFENSTKLFD